MSRPSTAAAEPVAVGSVRTVFGTLGLACTEHGLLAVSLPNESGAGIRARLAGCQAPSQPAEAMLALASTQVNAYMLGSLRRFTVPLDLRGTAFQHAVWAAVCEVPFGETRSYSAIARLLGRPAAARAVGHANGANPLPVVVPCHRLLGSDGALTGYAGGLAMKRLLLDHELRLCEARADMP